MPRGSSQLRLFVGCYPPADAAVQMLEPLRAIALPKHRETPLEQIHLTLHFIGDRAVKELDEVKESVRRSVAGLSPFALLPVCYLTLPKRGEDSRVIALETNAPPALLEIHRRLVLRLAREPRKNTSDKYLPHFTLTRFKPPARGFRLREEDVETNEVPTFRIDRIALMRSTLRARGADHSVVEEFTLA